jgi:uncharacterized membrane protein (UPF0127 family)
MLVLALAAALGAGACGDRTDPDPAPPQPTPPDPAVEAIAAVQFDTATVTFITATDSIRMRAEVAERADQRAYGLMDRDSIAADAGMVFLYDSPQSGDTGFWMYRTRMALDIAYFDGSGNIIAFQQMMPCMSLDPARCPGYAAGAPFFGAVEARRGYFPRHGISVGDRVILPGRIGS